jgi:hypothetical protein
MGDAVVTYTVKIGRLYVGTNRAPRPPTGHNHGWRELVWAKQLIDAEKFSDRQSAHLWAKTWLAHDDFVVTAVSGEGPPTDDGGRRVRAVA